jgi:hypothetical protein
MAVIEWHWVNKGNKVNFLTGEMTPAGSRADDSSRHDKRQSHMNMRKHP